MRRWLIRLAAVVGIVLLGLALRRTVLAPKPLEVKVAAVAQGRVESTVTNSRAGTIKARRRAQISPEVGGRAIEIPHREGEKVKAGDVLLRLDDRVLQGQLAVARRQLQSAEAQRRQTCSGAERSHRELARQRNLANQGIISTDALDAVASSSQAADAGCSAAQAGIEQARATIELTQRQASQMVIHAPFDGIVAKVSIELGEFTTPSPPGLPIPPVIDLIDPASIYVSAPMDEADSARIQPGQPVRITVDSYPGRSFPGRVSRLAPYVLDREEQNRTIEIEADFVDLEKSQTPLRLLPGTSADVEVILEVRENVLRVPTPALLEGNRVLVVQNGRLVERKLTIGLKNWDWTEVLSGLAPGDAVVTTLDSPDIKAGAAVRIAPDGEKNGKSP
ncbi:MAG TPA: efflux RND transporter periplasmic adaptor subunit [Thermoanaerobaculia bacterium]|nr:efflux RND transporter periplasmic adaptor subunit [Thermoanaerobaculia bacterium]